MCDHFLLTLSTRTWDVHVRVEPVKETRFRTSSMTSLVKVVSTEVLVMFVSERT